MLRADLSRSSVLDLAQYDEARNELRLTFKSGGTYRYLLVPRHIFDALATAASPGSFFASSIRGHYPEELLK